MIIIDYSGIVISGIFAISKQLDAAETQEDKINIIRHVVLNSILGHKKKYSAEYGEVVIACDGPTYWRREYFKEYKANRKKNREASDIDWDTVFKAMSLIREELIQFFPYKVLIIDRCEADDIIACLTKEYRTEFGKMQKVMIISSDNDMCQLLKYSNVSQYSPLTKKMIKLNSKQVKEFLNTAIVKGQKKDGVPSIKQADDALILEDKERAAPISAKLLNSFLEKGIDACKDDVERARYTRNKTVIDFDCIPEDVYNSIINTFDNTVVKFDRMKLMNFLMQKRCRVLLDSIHDF